MPTTATIVTRDERNRDLPYLDAMKSDMVVILFSFAIWTIFLRTTHQSAAIIVGPIYIVRKFSPALAAFPTLP